MLGSPDGSISTLGQHHLHPLGSTLPPWNWNSGIPKLPIFTLTPRPSMVSMDCCCSSRRVAALTSPADVRRLLLVLQLVWPPRAQPERISSRDARRLPAMLVFHPSRRAPHVHSAHVASCPCCPWCARRAGSLCRPPCRWRILGFAPSEAAAECSCQRIWIRLWLDPLLQLWLLLCLVVRAVASHPDGVASARLWWCTPPRLGHVLPWSR